MYRQLAVAEGNEPAKQGTSLQSYKNSGRNSSGQLLL